ncbi:MULTISPECIES: hypothetical protein [unclassified Acidovorax]|uniref:hypothetical protein n=1 Tax=unclassified Acidovorax TaxID=2684926 RepID=UPI002883295C|nr:MULTISPECIES: hypothetical protein [unclassified Acidovorax]
MKILRLNLSSAFLVILAIAFACAFYRTAWVAEDAFITFRVINNWIEGYGLRWNVNERVQAYTHPLWLFLLTPLVVVFADPYWSAIILSFALLLILLILMVVAMGGPHPVALIAIASLLWCQAFVDYSSSGLENPLTHVLLAAFVIGATKAGRRSVFILSLLLSLVYLTRPDAVLILIPALIVSMLQSESRLSRKIFDLINGFLPIIIWSVFSMFYYGAFVPNTALAKLQNGLGIEQSILQGWNLIEYSVENDLPTALVILAGLAAGLVRNGTRPIVFGLLFWFAYLFYSGGDYMAGRFLSGPLVVCAIILGICLSGRLIVGVIVFILSLNIYSLNKSILSPVSYFSPVIGLNGIADERAFYYPYLGVRPAIQYGWKRHPWLIEGYALNGSAGGYIKCVIGMVGYGAGATVRILDPFALADPFLARLPARSHARVGHYERAFPEGFLESYITGVNHLKDEKLARLWRDVDLVTTAPLLSEGRLEAIMRLNFQRHIYRPMLFDKESVGLPGTKRENRAEHSCLGVPYGGLYLWRLF